MDVWVVEYLNCISVTCDSNFIAYANASLLLSLPMWHLWSDFIIFKNVFYTFYHHAIWLIWEERNTHDFFFFNYNLSHKCPDLSILIQFFNSKLFSSRMLLQKRLFFHSHRVQVISYLRSLSFFYLHTCFIISLMYGIFYV